MSIVSNLIRNLSVRIKLLSGFMMVLLILLLISVLSYNALNSLTGRFQLIADVSETNLLISEARQQEKNFMLHNDKKHYQQALDITDNARQLGEKSLALFTNNESAELMRELLLNLGLYQQQLNQLASIDMLNNKTEALAIEERMTQVALAADDAGTRSVQNQLAILEQEMNELEWLIIIAAVIAMIVGVSAAVVITQMVVAPLQQVVEVAEKIAAGDLTANLPTDRLDEPGQLMAAMQRMSISLRALINNLTAGIAQLATATEEMAAISEQNSAGVKQQKKIRNC